MFEVTYTDLQHVSVMFEHPLAPASGAAAMAVLELDLTNPSSPSCSLDLPDVLTEETLEEGEERGPLIKEMVVDTVLKKSV